MMSILLDPSKYSNRSTFDSISCTMASVYATGGDLRITNTSSNTIDRTVIVLEYTKSGG